MFTLGLPSTHFRYHGDATKSFGRAAQRAPSRSILSRCCFCSVDDNTKLRCRVLEYEASHGNQEAVSELGAELNQLRQRNEYLNAELLQRDKDLESLRSSSSAPSDRVKVSARPHTDAVRFVFRLVRDGELTAIPISGNASRKRYVTNVGLSPPRAA